MSLRPVTDATRGRAHARRRAAVLASVVGTVMALPPAVTARTEPATTGTVAASTRLQHVVDDVRARMAIASVVTATIVPANPLMVSVEPARERRGGFTLSFEGRFLDDLTDAELQAVVAHELGHVWIFTHHPYLQTEELANEIAMRVVTRDALERVYDKVWARGGVKGSIARFPDQAVPEDLR
jgi:hypothetical protein